MALHIIRTKFLLPRIVFSTPCNRSDMKQQYLNPMNHFWQTPRREAQISPVRSKGFTLIELLIVVAIIAILAAIAVPNFLEAQTRAKVSRVRNDMRTMATAAEAYRVDNNDYP